MQKYIDTTPGDDVKADCANLIAAVTYGDAHMLDLILHARQPALDDGGIMGVLGYLCGTLAAILNSLEDDAREKIVAHLRKQAVKTAEDKPARAEARAYL